MLWVQLIQRRTCTFFYSIFRKRSKNPPKHVLYFKCAHTGFPLTLSFENFRIICLVVFKHWINNSLYFLQEIAKTSPSEPDHDKSFYFEMKWNESITACTCITAPSLLKITDDTTWGLRGLPHSFTRIRQYTRCLLAWRLFLEFDETNSNNSTRINTNITLSETNTMIL